MDTDKQRLACFMTRVQKRGKLRILAVAAVLTLVCSACTGRRYDANTAKEVQAKALAGVAVGYAQLGQKDKASQLLAQAVQSAKAMNTNVKHSTLAEVAIKYAEAGQYDQALQLTKAIKLDLDKKIALDRIALKAVEAGQYDQVLKITRGMHDTSSK